ncbi:MAG: hypothetical protein AAF141_12990, partial [Pseudomonadota bacterium]
MANILTIFLAGILLSLGVVASNAQDDPILLPDAQPGDVDLLTPFAPSILEEAPLNAAPGVPFTVDARLSAQAEPITSGLIWRVFDPTPNGDGTMQLIATAEGGTANLQLPPGDYLIHASFGRAGIARRVSVTADGGAESFVLNAGGLQLDASLGGARLDSDELQFEIYSSAVDERGERSLITDNVKPGQLVRLNSGTYHIVSFFGSINAKVRADLRVEAGKVTKAVMEQRGGRVDLKLVLQQGGEPIANTKWSIQTESGEEVYSSSQVQPELILAAGNYIAIAQNASAV